jgi:hypothetical protein
MMTSDHVADQIDTQAIVETNDAEPNDHGSPADGVDLDQVRELVLAAHPDVVPEMVRGATFDELMASVEPARTAYQRIVEEHRRASPAPKVAVQPGQRSASPAEFDSFSPLAKISEGLRRQG